MFFVEIFSFKNTKFGTKNPALEKNLERHWNYEHPQFN